MACRLARADARVRIPLGTFAWGVERWGWNEGRPRQAPRSSPPLPTSRSGRRKAWSIRLLREQESAGSNPAAPTRRLTVGTASRPPSPSVSPFGRASRPATAVVSKTTERKPWGFDSLPFRLHLVRHRVPPRSSPECSPPCRGGDRGFESHRGCCLSLVSRVGWAWASPGGRNPPAPRGPGGSTPSRRTLHPHDPVVHRQDTRPSTGRDGFESRSGHVLTFSFLAGWRNRRTHGPQKPGPTYGHGSSTLPPATSPLSLSRRAGAPRGLMNRAARLDTGAWDSRSSSPPGRQTGQSRRSERPVSAGSTPAPATLHLVPSPSGQGTRLTNGQIAGSSPAGTTALLSTCACLGLLVQWQDTGLANRRSGFDSPAVHSNRNGRTKRKAAGYGSPGPAANGCAPIAGHGGSNPSPSASASRCPRRRSPPEVVSLVGPGSNPGGYPHTPRDVLLGERRASKTRARGSNPRVPAASPRPRGVTEARGPPKAADQVRLLARALPLRYVLGV